MDINREPTHWELEGDIDAEEALEENLNKKSFKEVAQQCEVSSALMEHLMEKFSSCFDILGGAHLMTHEEVIRSSAHYEVLKYLQLLSEGR